MAKSFCLQPAVKSWCFVKASIFECGPSQSRGAEPRKFWVVFVTSQKTTSRNRLYSL